MSNVLKKKQNMEKQVKRFAVLDVTQEDVSIAFWYTNGEKEIVIIPREAAWDLFNSLSKV